MRTRCLATVPLLLTLLVTAPAAQAPQPPGAAGSAKIWVGRQAEIEAFLRTAPFVKLDEVPIGVTRPLRGFFAPGGPVASAAWKQLPPGRANGYWESYKSEIAAYELDKLLGLNMVPPAVEKRWKGELGAAILWVEPVRPWKAVVNAPKPEKWTREAVRMKMFDNLVANIDRNAGNLLVDPDWNLLLIDHSRAFVRDTKLKGDLARFDRAIWERMQALDEPTLQAALGRWLDRGSIRALLKRRDEMQKTVDRLVSTSSEALVYIR